jgi:hypothetical protein
MTRNDLFSSIVGVFLVVLIDLGKGLKRLKSYSFSYDYASNSINESVGV